MATGHHHAGKSMPNGRPSVASSRMSTSVGGSLRASLSSALMEKVEKATRYPITKGAWIPRSERERIEHEQYKSRITELEKKLQDMELECKESKETVEYVQLEAAMQAEEIKEMEKSIASERALHRADLDKLEELKAYCGQLYESNKAKEESLTALAAKFGRHREIFLENERKAQAEISKLDEVLDRVVSVLSEAGDAVHKCPSLKRLLDDLTASGRGIDTPPATNRLQQTIEVNMNNKAELKDDHNNHIEPQSINTN